MNFGSTKTEPFEHVPSDEQDRLYAAMVEALYGTPVAIIYGMMIINVIVLSAFFVSDDIFILGLGIALACVNAFRAYSHLAYSRHGRGCIARDVNQRYEWHACLGAWFTAAIVGLFGAYTVSVYPYQPASVLGVAQTMGYLAGVSGRNASRPWITAVQATLASVPFIIGLAMTGSFAFVLISAAVGFTLLATLSSVGSIHEVFVSRFKTMRKLESLATRDALTGLGNRYFFMKQLHEWYDNQVPATLLSIDLDNFKHVNDVFGHDVGDLLLQEASGRIRRCISRDDVVARIGGDEFLILSRDANPGNAKATANRIIDSLCTPYIIKNVALRAGASIGIVTGNREQPETILKKADLALYAAKDAGKNQSYFYSPDLSTKYDDRIALERDLRIAMENGQIALAYQPIVDPKTNRIIMAEALMRWEHHARGPIPPTLFVPIAETTGLITSLGAWVLQTACRTAATWPNDIGVSVNLSARQFRKDHDLVAIVSAALNAARLAPERLTLEITESVLIEDPDFVIGVLSRLREMGVLIALDDFGTGYSSLGYLAELPLDKLKIDRAFATSMTTSLRSSSLMKGITQIARDLDLQVIIEGIETSAQVAAIKSFHVHGIQGYVFARPMSSVDLSPLLIRKLEPVDKGGKVNQLVRRRAPKAA